MMSTSTIENVSYKDVLEGNHSPADILIQIVDPGCDFPRPYYSFKETYQLNFFDEAGEHVLEDSQALLLINILKGGLLNNKSIIVHCHAGICRSGAVVEGAFSIDIAYRLLEYSKNQIKSWWPQEELSFEEMNKCLRLYKKVKPDIVVTHTCPTSIEEIIGNPRTLQMYGLDGYISRTHELLQAMLDIHRPAVWAFGHFHKSWSKNIRGTEFRCLSELEAFKL